ncbi:putative peptidase A1 family protein [Lyophyllum shimeji]|uniref:Peptidase A1 family protein n=1 Tax=Lyophyllum shimeji TaxID=47721 RepID=A0A9P3Q131_LYOSH|nr:putative peptidase A1 family protein [Lyophyllum shimeji]
MPTWQAKGKARAVAQTEGPGGTEGIVLPLQVAGSGVYDIAYTIEVSVGAHAQKLSLQVDTGSSDLWITSKSCTSSVCGQTGGHSYDPSGSTSTGAEFDITYLQGTVSGPVVWDQFEVGGYSIDNQALAAADTISSEPLSPLFTGILGLALPLNSIIAERIPPVTDNSPDGAAWASNLFSITPISSAPAARFLSLLLSRPGSTTVPAQLGIGRHPAFVNDPSKVRYSTLVSEKTGTLFWKVQVRAITVWVNGQEKPVEIGRSNTGGVFPSAVLDSGVPLILTTSQVANGIYGAIGISPGSDGQYYVPCTTPLNLTISLDDRPPLPLHPLDLTAEPPKDNQAAFCIGLIQSADSVLAQANSPVGDMIFGVPFLRNVYTVMAYTPPDTDGSFNPVPSSSSPAPPPATSAPVSIHVPAPPASSSSTPAPAPSRPATHVAAVDATAGQEIRPRLGLLGLTDPTVALDEFKRVRVLNQPISPGGSSSSNGSGSNNGGGKRPSVGIIVLIGLLGFFALCLGLFGVRWWVFRRRYRRAPLGMGGGESGAAAAAAMLGLSARGRGGEKEGGYALAARGSRDLDTTLARKGTKKKTQGMSDHGLVDLGLGNKVSGESEQEDEREREERELGYRRARGATSQGEEDVWDPRTALSSDGEGWGDETLVAVRGAPVTAHERTLSVGVPLLHEIDVDHSRETETEAEAGNDRPHVVDEFGVRSRMSGEEDDDEEGGGTRNSMAGIGTAARGGKIGIGVVPWNPNSPTLGRTR